MTREERENALHCLKVMIDEEVCEECNLYGTTGTDHCEADCVRVAIKALEQAPTTKNDLGVDAITMEQINKYVIEINKILEEEKDDARWCAGLRYSLRVLDKYCGKEQRDDTK